MDNNNNINSNGFTNTVFDSCLNKYLNFRFSQRDGSQKKDSAHDIKLFYKSQMHANYKIEENIIRKIICDKVKPIERNSNLKLYIYYNNLTTHNLIMKNSLANCTNKVKQSNIVYRFT